MSSLPLRRLALLLVLQAVLTSLAGCGKSSSPAATPTAPAGRTASGDIPDTAVYLSYRGSGYSLDYVEGWTIRLGPGKGVTVADKDSSEVVAIVAGSQPISVVASADQRRLATTAPKYRLLFLRSVALQPGRSIRVQYRTLSAQDPVTGKRVPVVVDRYYIPGAGKHAVITLSTPAGVDNVDAFRRISHSFRW
jgi:hypothetical protein